MIIESLPTLQFSLAIPSFVPVIQGITVVNVGGMAKIIVKVVDN